MKSMIRFLVLAALVVAGLSLTALAQVPTTIPDSQPARHIGQNATVDV